jgi:hypothetical protein
MNEEKKYWKWKSTIIDFDNIKEEKADFGDYWTKKEMIFHYLGCPDDKIHEWYNGGWSCEYNYALSYAKEYGLVEDYIDYDDELYQKQEQLDKYKIVLDKIKEILKENIDDEFYINLTNKEKALYKINELLEEIE